MTRTWASVGIDESRLLNPHGENKAPCPKCGPLAKHAGKTDLSVNTATGVFNCWNNGEGCGFKGNLNAIPRRNTNFATEFSGPGGSVISFGTPPPRTYRRISREEYLAQTEPLPQEAIDWLHARGIEDETIKWTGLRWGVVTKDGETNQWVKGIFYPYLVKRGDADPYIANIKKRCICCKNHMQLAGKDKAGVGCELVFYGLTNVASTTIVVEGELDALAYYQAGIKNAISVPNGATLKSDTARLNYLESCREETDRIKHAIISVDEDQPGRLLKHELARRIGFKRCSYVVYPDGCKDANDVLLKYGPDALRSMVERAKPFPSEGIARPDDMLEELLGWQKDGMPSGYSTGWKDLDDLYRPVPGQLNIITGVPSHGKSAMVDALLVNLWRLHGWRSLIFSPENYPPSTHLVKLAELLTGKSFDEKILSMWRRKGFNADLMTEVDLRRAVEELQDGFSFILPDVDGEGHDLDGLLEIARTEVYRTGAKVLVIDPFNEIEHHIPKGMAKTDYIGQSLAKIRRFARHHVMSVYVVAHPTKMERRPEKFKGEDGVEQTLMTEPIPTAYDIADSANWYNKADNVIVVWRDKHAEVRGGDPHLNTISVQKIKLKWAGRPGTVQFRWDPPTGRYLSLDEQPSYDEQADVDKLLGNDW